jgi:hypothetical protein
MPDLESVPPELRWPIAAEAIGRTIGRWKWMPPRVAFAVAAVGLGPIALAMLLGVLGSGATGSTLIRAGFVAINLVGLLLAGVFLWNRLRQEIRAVGWKYGIPMCMACGHSLVGLPDTRATCSECGTGFADSELRSSVKWQIRAMLPVVSTDIGSADLNRLESDLPASGRGGLVLCISAMIAVTAAAVVLDDKISGNGQRGPVHIPAEHYLLSWGAVLVIVLIPSLWYLIAWRRRARAVGEWLVRCGAVP